MRVLSNAELTQRLEKLEQSFFASRSREVDNTYRSEDALNKADALTPYTETKTAYIGDTEVVFTEIPSGNITAYAEDTEGNNPYYVQLKRDNDRVTVVYEPFKYVTKVTISIS
jgi:hypothetical protein